MGRIVDTKRPTCLSVLLAEPRTNTSCRNEVLTLGSRGRTFQEGGAESGRQEAYRQGGDLTKVVLGNG